MTRPVKKESVLSEDELRYFFDRVNHAPLIEILTRINKNRIRFTGKNLVKMGQLKQIYLKWWHQAKQRTENITSPGSSLRLQAKVENQQANEYESIEFPSLHYLNDELDSMSLSHPAWQDALRAIDFDG